LAFHSDRSGVFDIYVMNADGTGLVKLTDSPDWDIEPSWSPDGELLAYYSERDGNFEVYVMNADGTGQIRLTDHDDFDGFPDWYP
jgi:TolB protein